MTVLVVLGAAVLCLAVAVVAGVVGLLVTGVIRLRATGVPADPDMNYNKDMILIDSTSSTDGRYQP